MGIFMFALMGRLAFCDMEKGLLLTLLIATFLLWIYAVIKWVPAGTEKKRVRDAGAR